jgi:peptidoglycan/LPS O-acetylase OafA/YrhL
MSMMSGSVSPGHQARTLDACLGKGQPNNFDFLRLFAACMVLFGHSFTLLEASPADRFPHDPVTLLIFKYMPFGQGLPGTGLHIFFFISGLLVTLSFINHKKNPLLFVWARALRILPAYWVSTLVLLLLVGTWYTTLPLQDYFKNPETWTFFWRNMLMAPYYYLPGVFTTNPFGASINGSTWTIPLEVQMYAWVFFFGLIGVLSRRLIFVAFFLICAGVQIIFAEDYIFLLQPGEPRLWIFFFVGMLAALYSKHIVISPKLWVIFTLIYFAAWQHENKWLNLLGAAYFAYSLLVFATYKYYSFLDVGKFGDYSYGIYLYSFPVQQLLIHTLKPQMNGWLFSLLSFLVCLPLAVASWHILEKPAMQLKRKIQQK